MNRTSSMHNINVFIAQIQRFLQRQPESLIFYQLYSCRYKVDLLNIENIILAFIKLQVLSRPGSHLGSTDTFVNRSLPLQIDFSSKLFFDFLHKLLSHIVSGFFVSTWIQLRNIQCCIRVDDMDTAK